MIKSGLLAIYYLKPSFLITFRVLFCRYFEMLLTVVTPLFNKTPELISLVFMPIDLYLPFLLLPLPTPDSKNHHSTLLPTVHGFQNFLQQNKLILIALYFLKYPCVCEGIWVCSSVPGLFIYPVNSPMLLEMMEFCFFKAE